MPSKELTRRDFLKLTAASLVSLAFKKARPFPPEDESTIDGDIEVVDHQETKGFLKSFNLPVALIPLRLDHLYDSKRQLQTFNAGGITLPFDGIYTLKLNDRRGLRATILPYITGESVLPVAVLDTGSFPRGSGLYIPTKPYWSQAPDDNIHGSYTYMAENETGATKIYPNKIWNILEGTLALAKYQAKIGPLVDSTAGEYSLLEILDLKRRHYKSGFTTGGAEVRAGGVCALSTVFGRSLKLSNFASSILVAEGWSHPSLYAYFIPPGEKIIQTGFGSEKLFDVAIDYGDTEHDFKWLQLGALLNSGQKGSQIDPLYLWIQGQVLPNGRAPMEDLEAPADARLIINLSWRTEHPSDDQVTRLKELQENYWYYHQTGNWEKVSDFCQPTLQPTKRRSFWISHSPAEIASLVYPEGGNNFLEELENDPYLSEIKTLAELLNQYADRYTYDQFRAREAPGAGEYLRNTKWYQELEDRRTQIEPALRHLDQNSFLVKAGSRSKDQAIQCIGWTILLSSLGYESSPKNIGGANITVASQLVPNEIKNGTYNYLSRHGYNFAVVDSLDQLNPGDQYILYDGAGHIGAVVDKKQIDGQTILLVADANRQNDGRVHIFEVAEGNFDAVFGPARKVVIRRPN